MSNQYSGGTSGGREQTAPLNRPGQTQNTPRDAVSQAADLAGAAANSAKQAASDVTATMTGQVKDMLDAQLASGVEMVGHIGSSAHRAAEELDENAPQLAGIVRGLADRIEDYADDMRDQSLDDLVRSASDFTRRQPALVFGLAAIAGFFAFRTLKSAPVRARQAASPRSPSMGGHHGI